jgi:hypothetical protein
MPFKKFETGKKAGEPDLEKPVAGKKKPFGKKSPFKIESKKGKPFGKK